MDFSDTAKPLLKSEGSTYAWGATSTMSDKNGNLLFYTDGENIWNKHNKLMLNGTSLHGSYGEGQGSLIIPFVGDKYKYYVFTADAQQKNPLKNTPWQFQHDSSLSYTVVDMRLDGGNGGVVQKNIPLLKVVDQTLTAIQHANKKDYWLISKKYATDSFYVFKITECGISKPLIYKAGLPSLTGSLKSCIKASPNGKKISYVIPMGAWYHFLFDFNDSIGSITNALLLSHSFSLGGTSFSPNSRYLYAIDTFKVYCYDMLSTDILASKKLALTLKWNFSNMQLAKDGNIYATPNSIDSLIVIQNSNNFLSIKDVSTFYTVTNIGLPDTSIGWFRLNLYSISNSLESYYASDYKEAPDDSIIVTANNTCLDDSVKFEVYSNRNISKMTWHYGDGVQKNTSNLQYKYSKSGTYVVKLAVQYQCATDTAITNIVIKDRTTINNTKKEILTCNKDEEIILDAGLGFDKYIWHDGTHEQQYKTKNEGIFTVSAQNVCGVKIDSFEIKQVQLQVPNIITPNNDGLNETLVVNSPIKLPIQLYITNRWGGEVFNSTNYQNNWDANGLSDGIYYYTSNYEGCKAVNGWVQVVR